MDQNIIELNEKIEKSSAFIELLFMEIDKVIVGQKQMVERLLIGLLSNGHILLEGVPGLAKTLAVQTLANTISAKFQRIQFTPDLLPADVIGTLVFNPKTSEFETKKGPIFSNFILADEINRSPAKVQSALLEAMQERQVTIGHTTFKLEEPFLVLATQNPLEHEGTYPLPEAQLDRFMLKVIIDYPSRTDEKEILKRNILSDKYSPRQVVKVEEILNARKIVREIYMDEKIEKYILDLVFATRYPEEYGLEEIKKYLLYGASPRATINLALASKSLAFIKRRGYVIPEDVRLICKDVLRHRIGLTYEAEADDKKTVDIIDIILNRIEVP